MSCEMCGKDKPVVRGLVEGAEMNVCAVCARFGTMLATPVKAVPKLPAKKVLLPSRVILSNAGVLVKEAREKLGLSQKDFALRINETQNVLHKIEIGQIIPSVALTRKLEKALKIRLIEEQEDAPVTIQKSKSGALTIGDVVKIKGD